MTRYLRGWFMFVRAVYYARAKKRGAGAMPWRNAFKMGACYRWLVDGQMRGGKPPRFIRRGFRKFGAKGRHAKLEAAERVRHEKTAVPG